MFQSTTKLIVPMKNGHVVGGILPHKNHQWIGFLGKILTGKPHIFHGKIHGFRLKCSQENQSIEP